MNVHVLQHVPFEGLGAIDPWLVQRGARLSWTRLHEAGRFPDLADFDLLIALGGPMSVNDEDRLPWLAAEKRFVAQAIAAGRAVLGICLGAQLIASAAGAKVYPNREREIGWHPVVRAPATGESPWRDALPARLEAFHWHGETFDLPAGASHLARSEACEHQAFALGDRVLGLQFHLETTADGARALVEHCPGDLAPGPFVEGAARMLAEPARFARAHAALDPLLARLAASAGGEP